jgi:LysM repeat protein
MANRKMFVILTSLLVLAAIALSACQMSYSTVVPEASPSPGGEDSLFVSPVATTDNAMDMVAEFATGSAIAGTSVALTQGTPPSEPQATQETPDGVEITPGSATQASPEATEAPPTEKPTTAPTTITSRPATYTLQSGEYPYCIARRYNVDPGELLSLSGLSSNQGNYLSPGTVLKIPQSGKQFPGERALRSHPATYVVGSTSDAQTIYAVACYYGDVDPAAIANANGLSLGAALNTGQQLSIP